MPVEKPLELSRYCVPFTPFDKKLAESAVCLVTTASVRQKDQPAFNVEGDNTFRVIDGTASAPQLTFDDAHYDHACVDKDINCVFPIERLRELVREQRIGAVTEKHFSLGFSQALRELRETTIPKLVREVDQLRPDVVLLTGG